MVLGVLGGGCQLVRGHGRAVPSGDPSSRFAASSHLQCETSQPSVATEGSFPRRLVGDLEVPELPVLIGKCHPIKKEVQTPANTARNTASQCKTNPKKAAVRWAFIPFLTH